MNKPAKFFIVASFVAFTMLGCKAGGVPPFCDGYTAGGTRNMESRCGELIKKNEARNLEKYMKACEGYGFQKGTSEFANCLLTLDQNNTKNQAIQDANSGKPNQSIQVQPFSCIKAGSILQCN